MKPRSLLAFLCLAFATCLPAAEKLSEADSAAVLAKAKALQKAFEDCDAEAIIRGTHPIILKFVGTKEEFEKLTREAVKSMVGKLTFEKTEWGEVTPSHMSGEDEVCFVPKVSIMNYQGQRIRSVSYLIAARVKGKQDWLFLDSAPVAKNPALLWTIFPGLPKDVVTPPNSAEPAK
jgi:hypothetical protein